MKKDEAMKNLYRIQSQLGCKEFPGDPMMVNIFLKIEELISCKSKYDDLADLVSDYRSSYNYSSPQEEEYKQNLLEKIRNFKL